MVDRNPPPRAPSGSNDEARRFISTHEKQFPVRRPMPVPAKAAPSAGGGGFVNEYDPTMSYPAGALFAVAAPRTIAGIAVAPGLYAVPVAGTDGLGTWAGSVPANPTGNQVPQFPLPVIGAAPNDKFFARLVAGYCPNI